MESANQCVQMDLFGWEAAQKLFEQLEKAQMEIVQGLQIEQIFQIQESIINRNTGSKFLDDTMRAFIMFFSCDFIPNVLMFDLVMLRDFIIAKNNPIQQFCINFHFKRLVREYVQRVDYYLIANPLGQRFMYHVYKHEQGGQKSYMLSVLDEEKLTTHAGEQAFTFSRTGTVLKSTFPMRFAKCIVSEQFVVQTVQSIWIKYFKLNKKKRVEHLVQLQLDRIGEVRQSEFAFYLDAYSGTFAINNCVEEIQDEVALIEEDINKEIYGTRHFKSQWIPQDDKHLMITLFAWKIFKKKFNNIINSGSAIETKIGVIESVDEYLL